MNIEQTHNYSPLKHPHSCPLQLFWTIITLFVAPCSLLQSASYNIYLDADRTRHYASARSIEIGIKTAFAEHANKIQGHEIHFIVLDHRGNTVRSHLHMQRYIDDPNALIYFAGLHSPPLIKHREYINENKILTLVPWAAGGPITRATSKNNWIFRLSVDDTKAGAFLAKQIKKAAYKKAHLLLEKTPWGESNYLNISKELNKNSINYATSWFNWNTQENTAKIILSDVADKQADAIIFIGNAIEGRKFIDANHSMQNPLPVLSHWGITGGNFAQVVSPEKRNKTRLQFIQTKFSFTSQNLGPYAKSVFNRAQELYPQELQTPENLKAPTGFVHAYDISQLLIAAMKEAKLTGHASTDKTSIKNKLEALESPIQGLIKTYTKPFRPYSTDDPDAHEALDINDLSLGYYDDSGAIYLIEDSIQN